MRRTEGPKLNYMAMMDVVPPSIIICLIHYSMVYNEDEWLDAARRKVLSASRFCYNIVLQHERINSGNLGATML